MEHVQRWEWSWEGAGEPGEAEGAGEAHPGEKLDQRDPSVNPGEGQDLVPGNKGQDEASSCSRESLGRVLGNIPPGKCCPVWNLWKIGSLWPLGGGQELRTRMAGSWSERKWEKLQIPVGINLVCAAKRQWKMFPWIHGKRGRS